MKKFLALLISLSMIIMCVPGISLVASAEEVTLATEGDVYLISTGAEFASVFGVSGSNSDKLESGKFKQTANITLDAAYTPNTTTAFKGEYNGNGKTISITTTLTAGNFGVFGLVESAKFTKVTVDGTVDGSGKENVGGFAYKATKTTFTDCVNSIDVTAKKNVAGFVPSTAADTNKFNGCVNEGAITGTDQIIGGFTSRGSSEFVDCINKGTVTGPKNVGGFMGFPSATTAKYTNCINAGNISSSSGPVAGFVGAHTGATITNCVNIGDIEITGTSGTAGGLLGLQSGAGTVTMTASYNTGNVTGYAIAGGLIGRGYYSNGTKFGGTNVINDCYNTGVVSGLSKSTKKASAIGVIADASDASSEAYSTTVNNFYDIANSTLPTMIEVPNDDDYTLTLSATNLYVLNGTSDADFGTIAITAEELSNHPVSLSTEVWEVKEGYAYPQLIENPHLDLSTLAPTGLALNDGILTWNPSTASKYSVYVNGSEAIADLTVTTADISELIAEDGSYTIAVAGLNALDIPVLSEEITYEKKWLEGSGTAADPYLIPDAQTFMKLFSLSQIKDATYITGEKYYKQTADIDLSSYDYKPYITAPTSTTAVKFAGNYNGNNKTIKVDIDCVGDATPVDKQTQYYGGLFNFVAGSVYDLTIEGSIIGSRVGAVASEISGTITNVVNKATIESKVSSYCGGIVGYGNKGTFINCRNEGVVKSSTGQVGGIAGDSTASTFTGCANYGQVIGTTTSAGGIAGRIMAAESETATIEKCFNAGLVQCGKDIGGIVGIVARKDKNNQTYNITDCYNRGKVTKTYTSGVIGAIVGTTVEMSAGYTAPVINITNCYANTNAYEAIGTVNSAATLTNIKLTGDIDTLNAAFNGLANWTVVAGAYPEITGNVFDTSKITDVLLLMGGSGTETDPYIVSSAEIFVKLFGNGDDNTSTSYLNNKYFKQTADIVLPADYTPSTVDAENNSAGVQTTRKVHYDGNNKSITLNIGAEDDYRLVTSDGFGLWLKPSLMYIDNLTAKGDIYTRIASGHLYTASMVANGSAYINNCVNEANISVKGGNTVGGLAARLSDGSVTNCENKGTISGVGNVAGIVGWAAANVADCVNNGTIISTSGGSGVVYTFNGTRSFERLVNNGDIAGNESTAGGIFGAYANTTTATISECYNTGSVTGHNVGGIFAGIRQNNKNGYTADITISDCYNTGVLTGDSRVGSCVGNAEIGHAKCTIKLTVENFYDIANPTMDAVNVTPSDPTNVNQYDNGALDGNLVEVIAKVTNAYVLNAADKLDYGTAVTTDTLTSLESTGFSSEKWIAPTGNIPYVQLKNNLYDGVQIALASPISVASNSDIFYSVELAEDETIEGIDTFVIVAAKFNKIASITEGYKYGILISPSASGTGLTAETAKYKAEGAKNIGGSFGILFHGDLKAGNTYYVRPYVEYNDTYVYGTPQTFVMPAEEI